VDVLFNMYDKEYWYWKFLSQFAERGLLVFFITFLDDVTALRYSFVLLLVMFVLSCWFAPFKDDELDVADKQTRFTNVVNVLMGVCVEEKVSEQTSKTKNK